MVSEPPELEKSAQAAEGDTLFYSGTSSASRIGAPASFP